MPSCVTDSFNRADSTTTLGTTDTGETWVLSTQFGTAKVGIASNRAYWPSDPNVVTTAALVDTSLTIDFSYTLTWVDYRDNDSVAQAFLGNGSDFNTAKFYYVFADSIGRLSIRTWLPGSRLIGADNVVTGITDGDVIKIEVVSDATAPAGFSILVYRNGTLGYTHQASAGTDWGVGTFPTLGGWCGFFKQAIAGANAARVDDFEVCPLGPTLTFVPPLQVGHHGTHLPPGIAGPPLRAGPAAGGQFSPQVQRGHRY